MDNYNNSCTYDDNDILKIFFEYNIRVYGKSFDQERDHSWIVWVSNPGILTSVQGIENYFLGVLPSAHDDPHKHKVLVDVIKNYCYNKKVNRLLHD